MQPIDVAIEAMNYLATRSGKAEATAAPSAQQITEAERMLGCRLPPSFVAFLIKAGGKVPADWDMYWIGGPDMFRRNIVIANDLEREHAASPLPDFLVTFYEDGCGDQFCFDLRRPGGGLDTDAPPPVLAAVESIPQDDEALRQMAVRKIFHANDFGENEHVQARAVDAREYPIVIWDRAQGLEQLEEALCVVADNFTEWLKTHTHDQL